MQDAGVRSQENKAVGRGQKKIANFGLRIADLKTRRQEAEGTDAERRRRGDAARRARKAEDRRQRIETIVVIRYPLFVRSVAMNCSDDFYYFYDFYGLND